MKLLSLPNCPFVVYVGVRKGVPVFNYHNVEKMLQNTQFASETTIDNEAGSMYNKFCCIGFR